MKYSQATLGRVFIVKLETGRSDTSVTGCIRRGVRVWGVLEVVVIELTKTTALKKYDDNMDNYMLDFES